MEQPKLGDVCRALSRVAVLAFALGALALSQGPSDAGGDEAGLRFTVHCSESSDAGGVTCALVVSGLPAPLDDQVSVVLLTGQAPSESPHASTPVDTVVASAAPSISPGPSVLVSRHLPPAPPALLPLALQVPAPPPRSL